MITVTERAKVALRDMLHENVDIPQACLRMKMNGKGGFGLGIDIELAGDKSLIFEGETILVVEEQLATKLKHVMLDLDESEEGAELVIIELAGAN